MALLYKADPARGAEWRTLLAERRPDLKFHIWPESHDANAVRVLAMWTPEEAMFARYPNLEIVISTGAGVDQFDLSAIPPHIPLIRMSDPGIIAAMTEYVLLGVLTLHRDALSYRQNQRADIWKEIRIVPAARRHIGVLGLGRLGENVARQLRDLGFPVLGWSRTPRNIEGVTCYSGNESLRDFATQCNIVVCLLPLTNETRHIINAEFLSWLPEGASLVNAGRGAHAVTDDLLAALDSGRLSGAVLDVTDPEPLPPGHPLWQHPRVMITPHVATMTDPAAAVDFVLETMDRHQQGSPLRGLIDRSRGY